MDELKSRRKCEVKCFQLFLKNNGCFIPVLINQQLLTVWLFVQQFFYYREHRADTAAGSKMKNRFAGRLLAVHCKPARGRNSGELIANFVMINDMPAYFAVRLPFDHYERMLINSVC